MSNEQNPFDALMPTDMTIKAEEVGIYKATKTHYNLLYSRSPRGCLSLSRLFSISQSPQVLATWHGEWRSSSGPLRLVLA